MLRLGRLLGGLFRRRNRLHSPQGPTTLGLNEPVWIEPSAESVLNLSGAKRIQSGIPEPLLKGNVSIHLPPSLANDRLVESLKALAAESSGTMQVLESAGRKHVPDELVFTPRDVPAQITGGQAFISADVRIDTVQYAFHAYPHPTSHSRSRYWLYYAVTGPTRGTGLPGEFQITDEFRWTGDRPWSPLLVKYALKEWLRRPEVIAATIAAKAALPKLPPYSHG